MKIKISYGPGEKLRAVMVSAAVRKLLPDARAKESDRHPPHKQIYITTKEPKKALQQ